MRFYIQPRLHQLGYTIWGLGDGCCHTKCGQSGRRWRIAAGALRHRNGSSGLDEKTFSIARRECAHGCAKLATVVVFEVTNRMGLSTSRQRQLYSRKVSRKRCPDLYYRGGCSGASSAPTSCRARPANSKGRAPVRLQACALLCSVKRSYRFRFD